MSLVFQDKHSRSLQISGKHVVFRRWSTRENRTLHRTLRVSHKLTKLSLPGKGDDKILGHVAECCPLLEELDISNSFVTDVGLLAICGVTVENMEVKKRRISAEEERGKVDRTTGKFVRAAAARARERLDKVRHDPKFLQDLAAGRGAADLLRHKFGSLTARMKPYMDARASSSGLPTSPSCSSSSCSSTAHSWSPTPGILHSFSGKGCRYPLSPCYSPS